MVRAVAAVIAVAAATAGAALAQFRPLPAPPYHAMTPGEPRGTHRGSPVQQQVLQNYRTELQQAQRELLQRNPSGLGREQLEIGRQLNTVDTLGAAYGLPVLPSPGAAPRAPLAAPQP